MSNYHFAGPRGHRPERPQRARGVHKGARADRSPADSLAPQDSPATIPEPFPTIFSWLHQVRNILKIELGKYEMETWYFSPYPPEYADCDRLYVCEVRMRGLPLHVFFPVLLTTLLRS